MDANHHDDHRSTLVLSRRRGEGFWVGELLHVSHHPSGPRVEIEAPRDLPVWREELLQDGVPHGGKPEAGGRGRLVLGVGRHGQRIVCGHDQEITIDVRQVAGGGNQLKIAVTAPRDIPIRRDELAAA